MPERIRPSSLTELAQAVAWAVAEERLVAIRGCATKQGIGRPVLADLVIETTGLAGIDLYEPEELVMSAGAGTPLATVQAALAERRQQLAFEPADWAGLSGGESGADTIGGVFACNLAGPRRLKDGAARDHLLGVQLVTGRGEAIKSGGRVVKNVTGYDLCKLMAGSMGTLGVLSRVTFKVLPAPPAEATLLVAGPGFEGLLTCLRKATHSSAELSAAAALPESAAARSAVPAIAAAGRALAAIRLEGIAPSVASRLDILEAAMPDGVELARLDDAASRTLWAEIRDGRLLPATAPVLWRLSVTPTAAAGIVTGLAALAPEIVADWAGGLLWVALPRALGEDAAVVRGALAGQGHATLIRAPEALRRAVPPFEPLPDAHAALARRVKESFDPKRVLNRGRMYEGL